MAVAVLCARNQRNAGMYSVDLAAQQFFGKVGVPFVLCRSQGDPTWGELQYNRFRAWDELSDFDAVVYWGDWQTHPKYGAEDYPYAEAKYEGNRSTDDAIRRWRSIYQLTAARSQDRRPMLTVGCSFLGLEEALCDPAAREAFSTYIGRSDLIIPRDPSSYDVLTRLFPGTGKIVAGGLDPALLAELPRRPERITRSGNFAYCFDRELRSSARQIVGLVQKLSGARPVRVDWNKRRFPRRLRHKDFSTNIQTISETDFCLTDLYHLATNAINLAVPIICCGQSRERTSVTMNSDKKLSLMSQFGLRDFYIEAGSDLQLSLEAALELVYHERTAVRLSQVQSSLVSMRRCIAEIVGEHLRMV